MTEARLTVGILDDYQAVALKSADWSPVSDRCDITVFDRPVDLQSELALLRDFDVLCLMRERTPFPRHLIAALPRLRLLVTTGGGNAAIDLQAAREHGVTVCGTRNGDGRRVTAELAWGLVLAGSRGLGQELRSVAIGGWQVGIGQGVWGRTLGLLGLGHIGTMMASYGRAFGMDVIAWSDHLTPDRAAAVGARLVSREELFAQADVVSIHQVLSDRTAGSVGTAELALMKPTAVLVNTSRGPIIDEAALIEALDQGRLLAAALDVFAEEPLPVDHRLRNHPRVIATPHIGYVETQVYSVFFTDTVTAIADFLDGKPLERMLQPTPAMVGVA